LSVKDINEQCVSKHLYAPNLSEPDILIRTANERRISNFLLWQISYSEFYVTKVYWPDFMEKDLEDAIIDYAQRERRFGDIKKGG
jgi:undecaprenyl diphosphate synthase